MKTRFIALITLISIAAMLIMPCAVYAEGGSESDPYLIYSDADWQSVPKKGFIKLMNDVETSKGYKMGASVVIDLNGYSFKHSGSKLIEVSSAAHEVTVTDSSEAKTGSVSAAAGQVINMGAGKLRLDNIRMHGGTNSCVNINSAAAEVSINGGTYEGTAGISISNAAAVTIKNANINTTGVGINAQNSAQITIDSSVIKAGTYALIIKGICSEGVTVSDTELNAMGTVSAVDVSNSFGEVNFNSSAISVNANGKGAVQTSKTFGGTLNINGGSVINENILRGYALYDGSEGTTENIPYINLFDGEFCGGIVIGKPQQTKTVIAVKGGTYNFDPSEYVDLSAYEVSESGDGVWTVISLTDPDRTPAPKPSAAPTPSIKPSDEPTVTPTSTAATSPEPSEDVKLAVDSVYSSNMVFQKDEPIVITGTGHSGEIVKVSFNNMSASSLIEAGMWRVSLPAMDVVLSEDMTISAGDETLTLNNIAVGQVILCSGQSNMSRSLKSFKLTAEADRDYDNMRLYTSGVSESWSVATVSNAMGFSALGYMTGKRLSEKYNGEMPIGVVTAAYDGSAITAWVDRQCFYDDPDLMYQYTSAGGKSTYYNTRIIPIRNYKFSSAIWYQGESNSWYRNNNYEKALSHLIKNWRETFNDHELPFAVVQLPTADFAKIYTNRNTSSCGIGVRDGQWKVSEYMDNVETVVAIDHGWVHVSNEGAAHPLDKEEIADRLANLVMHYQNPNDDSIVYRSPSYESSVVENGKVIISFKDVRTTLVSSDGEALRAFKIKNNDGEYVDAEAVISEDGQKVIINAEGMNDPQIRYAWSDVPSVEEGDISKGLLSNVNFKSSEGLPIPPFRTDSEKYYIGDDGTVYNYAPAVSLYSPADKTAVRSGEDIELVFDAYDTDGSVENVEVFVNEKSIGNAEKISDRRWRISAGVLADGTHTVYAVATDNDGTTSVKQSATLGTTENLYPSRYSFVVGEYSSKPAQFKYTSVEELKDGIQTVGSASVTDGIPNGYFRSAIKLETVNALETAQISIPLEENSSTANSNIITVETNLYMTSESGSLDGTKTLEFVTNSGVTVKTIYIINNQLKLANDYYVLPHTLTPNTWYKIKMQVDISSGTFKFMLDDKVIYDTTWILRTKDFSKQYPSVIALRSGIKSVNIRQNGTSSTNNRAAAYFDGISLGLFSYADAAADEYSIADLSVNETSVITKINGDTEALSENATMYLAAYDKDGGLIRVQILEAASENIFENVKNAAYYTAYLWDAENMAPYCDKKEG